MVSVKPLHYLLDIQLIFTQLTQTMTDQSNDPPDKTIEHFFSESSTTVLIKDFTVCVRYIDKDCGQDTTLQFNSPERAIAIAHAIIKAANQIL